MKDIIVIRAGSMNVPPYLDADTVSIVHTIKKSVKLITPGPVIID